MYPPQSQPCTLCLLSQRSHQPDSIASVHPPNAPPWPTGRWGRASSVGSGCTTSRRCSGISRRVTPNALSAVFLARESLLFQRTSRKVNFFCSADRWYKVRHKYIFVLKLKMHICVWMVGGQRWMFPRKFSSYFFKLTHFLEAKRRNVKLTCADPIPIFVLSRPIFLIDLQPMRKFLCSQNHIEGRIAPSI